MTLHNGKLHRFEPAVPGNPRIRHTEFQAACDRFLISRGLMAKLAFNAAPKPKGRK